MELFRKTDSLLFHWSEFLNLAVLCAFYSTIDRTFFWLYGVFLMSVGIMKLWGRYIESRRYRTALDSVTEHCTLLGYVMALSEFALIFLTYTQISVVSEFVVIAAFFAAFAGYFAFSDLPDTGKIKLIVLIVSSAALLFCFVCRNFSWTTELARLVFVMSLIMLFERRESYLLGTLLMMAAAAVMLLNHEGGTVFALVLAFDVFCVTSDVPKVRRIALILTGIAFLGWLIIFLSPALYQMLYDTVSQVFSGDDSSTRATIHNTMQRMFFRYESTDQLMLINRLIRSRSKMEWFTALFSIEPYVEIIAYENGGSTSSADYVFSLIMYHLGPLVGFLLAVSGVMYYSRSVIRHSSDAYRMIPVLLLTQTLVHTLGNLMLTPFTGVPYIFLSHGGASLLCNFVMIALLTDHELKEG